MIDGPGERTSLVALWHRHEKLRFLVVGGWNTAFGYLCFAVLYLLLHDRLHYLVIGALAQGLAIVNAYLGHRWLVFRSRGPVRAEIVRFTITQVVTLGSGLVALRVLVGTFGVYPLLAQLLVTSCTVIAAYLLHRKFSFVSR